MVPYIALGYYTIKTTTTVNEFEKIIANLHFNDNVLMYTGLDGDKMLKIRLVSCYSNVKEKV